MDDDTYGETRRELTAMLDLADMDGATTMAEAMRMVAASIARHFPA